jgi:hypothetical protein
MVCQIFPGLAVLLRCRAGDLIIDRGDVVEGEKFLNG